MGMRIAARRVGNTNLYLILLVIAGGQHPTRMWRREEWRGGRGESTLGRDRWSCRQNHPIPLLSHLTLCHLADGVFVIRHVSPLLYFNGVYIYLQRGAISIDEDDCDVHRCMFSNPFPPTPVTSSTSTTIRLPPHTPHTRRRRSFPGTRTLSLSRTMRSRRRCCWTSRSSKGGSSR